MFDSAPEEWRQTTLGEVCIVKARIGWRGLAASEYTTDGPLLIAGKHIRSGRINWTACDHLSDARYDESPEIQLRIGDVILSKDGSIGNPALIESLPGRATINGTMMMLRPAPADLVPGYLFQFVNGPAFSQMVREKISGSSIPHIFQRDIIHFPVSLPPLHEQRRIAEVLRSVDVSVATTEATIEAAARLKSAVVEDFLANASLSSRLVRLESVIRSVDSGWSPDCEMTSASTGQWGVLKTSSVTWDGYDDEENKALPVDLEARPSLEVKPGDILITRAGQAYRTGVVALVEATAGRRMISDKLVRVRADESQILPVFLSETLKSKSVQNQLNPLKSGLTTLTNVTQKMIRGLEFSLPALDSQRDLAAVLLPLDQIIAGCRAQLRGSALLKAALGADLLSGRVRVPA